MLAGEVNRALGSDLAPDAGQMAKRNATRVRAAMGVNEQAAIRPRVSVVPPTDARYFTAYRCSDVCYPGYRRIVYY